MKVHEALRRASSFLRERGREARAAERLLCHHLDVARAGLFQRMHDPLPAKSLEPFWDDVKQHAGGVPVQYLIGKEDFYGRTFCVNRDVLIPRPETEELVAAVLQAIDHYFSKGRGIHVVDVGTGSGAIAVSLALENPRLSVSAVDLSEAALKVAERNAHRLGARVAFFHGDLLSPLAGKNKADVVVSNPPYISEEQFVRLDPLVKDHEPEAALRAGAGGLEIYRRLTAQLHRVISPQALIAFEVGIGQAGDVARLLAEALKGNIRTAVKKDMNGKDRIVTAAVGF